VETYKITFPVGRDNGIYEDFGVRGLPTTFFINKNGRIVKKTVGAISYSDLEKSIKELLE